MNHKKKPQGFYSRIDLASDWLQEECKPSLPTRLILLISVAEAQDYILLAAGFFSYKKESKVLKLVFCKTATGIWIDKAQTGSLLGASILNHSLLWHAFRIRWDQFLRICARVRFFRQVWYDLVIRSTPSSLVVHFKTWTFTDIVVNSSPLKS